MEIERRMWEALAGAPVLMLGGANVIMQLAKLPVGRGVAESKVESGRVDRHPVKRARTTLAYLAIAMFGTEEERAAYRREVNRSHRDVRSGPSAEVAYDAFNPDLQLWVAACIYVGAEQALQLTSPGTLEAGDGIAEAVYRHGARFGTTLQVPEDMWPVDRERFEEYWNEGVGRIEMDDVTRSYLSDFASLRFLPAPLARVLGPGHGFIAAGYLPAPFRDELGLRWSPRRQRFHDRVTKLVIRASRLTPGPIRRFPLNFYLWDTRRRIRDGTPIV
ncbi:MAG: DUF2236 domain-containing protein [Solirubrobacterales bacterium]|nr:DUF2236 domain-containing protein [Solirubrobacterales bacterium]